MVKPLALSEQQMQELPVVGQGRFCHVVYADWVDKLLRRLYGRCGLCLKVLRSSGDMWEGAPLADVVKLQNIAAWRGLAPRVYDIVQLPNEVLALVTDYAPPGNEPSLRGVERLARFLNIVGARTSKRTAPDGPAKWDVVTSNSNWSGDRFLDWGGLTLRNPQRYAASLRGKLTVQITAAHQGQPADHTYQALPELGISGARKFSERVQDIGLDNIDFRGKSVLDLGCNLGAFSFYAAERGARRVVGVDQPFLAEPMREAANWLEYWNIDFVGVKLPDKIDTDIKMFDIVLALSVCNHIGGYARWIADLCKDVLILEGHGGDMPDKYFPALRRDFKSVRFVGFTKDVYERPVFICGKEEGA